MTGRVQVKEPHQEEFVWLRFDGSDSGGSIQISSDSLLCWSDRIHSPAVIQPVDGDLVFYSQLGRTECGSFIRAVDWNVNTTQIFLFWSFPLRVFCVSPLISGPVALRAEPAELLVFVQIYLNVDVDVSLTGSSSPHSPRRLQIHMDGEKRSENLGSRMD